MNVSAILPVPGTGTGIHRYAEKLEPELQTAGVNVTRPQRCEIDIFGRGIGGYVSRWIWALTRSVPGDVVHATHYHQTNRAVNVATIHDTDPWEHPHEYGLGDRIHRRLLGDPADLAAVITPSQHVRVQVIDRFDLHPDTVHAIHHGVDDRIWHPDHDPDISQADIDILTVGELRPRKQIHRVLDALRRMNGLSIHWHHAGPPCLDQAYARTVRGRAKHLQREGKLTDHGYVTDEELRRLYSSVDVLVYPSRDEGFGFPPLEAAACGTPSVLTPLPVFRETLGRRFESLSERWPDSDEIAAAIRAAADDIYDPKKLRDTIRPLTWERAARETVDVYQEVLA